MTTKEEWELKAKNLSDYADTLDKRADGLAEESVGYRRLALEIKEASKGIIDMAEQMANATADAR